MLIIKNFPESYKIKLRDLHKKHPNWVFVGIKTKYNWLLLISFILFLFLLTASICIKTYDSYKCIGIVDNNQIIMKINSNNVKKVLEMRKKFFNFAPHNVLT